MRTIIYLVIVLGFLAGGLLDLREGEYKLAVVAMLFAAANGIIFFWR
jgi:uncharacterized SAM-binding protein YcdF (DUF218 family)